VQTFRFAALETGKPKGLHSFLCRDMKTVHYRFNIIITITLLLLINLACGPNFIAQVGPTATPTKTPKPPATATSEPTAVILATATPIPPTATPMPATNTPMPPTDTPTVEPTATATAAEAMPTETLTPEPTKAKAAPTQPPATPTDTPAPTATVAPAVAYKITHYKVLGEGENNGGIFNKGGQHIIFLTVLDAAGNGINGAVVKDKNGSSFQVVTGDKGPGKAEIQMMFDPYKLYVAADPSGPTTSEVSNAMNTEYPYLPDVVGKLGSLENETSVCPTLEIRCSPPFYNVHFSYEITFQKVQ
jgi:hypothetical protein